MIGNSKLTLITPAMAEAWLAEKAPNRSLKENKVLQFAQDMEAGLWRVTHQGIAFGEDGKLIDGQHRLEAIALAAKPVQMMVTHGIPKESMMVIDQAERRSFVDNIEIATGRHHNPKIVSVARALITLRPGARKAQSVDAVNRALHVHEQALATAAKPLIDAASPGVSSVLCCTAVVRAYYHLKADRLRALIGSLVTGLVDDPETDGSAIKLRDYLKSTTGKAEARQAVLVSLYRIERAVKAFADKERWGKMVAATEELFPLPEEGADTGRAGGVLAKMKKARETGAAAIAKGRTAQLAEERREKVIEVQRLRQTTRMTLQDIAKAVGTDRKTAGRWANEVLPKNVVKSFQRDSL